MATLKLGSTTVLTDTTLANAVQDNVTRLGTVTSGTYSASFGGDASRRTAKAWFQYNADTHVFTDSYNVSGYTDHGTGDFSILWDTNMADTSYCVLGSSEDDRCLSLNYRNQIYSDKCRFRTVHFNGNLYDQHLNCGIVFGDH